MSIFAPGSARRILEANGVHVIGETLNGGAIIQYERPLFLSHAETWKLINEMQAQSTSEHPFIIPMENVY